MRNKSFFAGKIVVAVLLVFVLLFGGSIIIAIANFLPKDNPLHFLLPPIFMVSWFVILLVYLSCGKKQSLKQPVKELCVNRTQAEPHDIARMFVENNKFEVISILVWMLAFGIIVSTTFIAGGTTLGGKIEDGKFYLGEKGEYVETSRTGYILSAVNSLIMGIFFPLAAYAGFSLERKTGNTRIPDKRFMIVVVVFASFIGGGFAIKSLTACLRAMFTF